MTNYIEDLCDKVSKETGQPIEVVRDLAAYILTEQETIVDEDELRILVKGFTHYEKS